jgi:hypothetical protein
MKIGAFLFLVNRFFIKDNIPEMKEEGKAVLVLVIVVHPDT